MNLNAEQTRQIRALLKAARDWQNRKSPVTIRELDHAITECDHIPHKEEGK